MPTNRYGLLMVVLGGLYLGLLSGCAAPSQGGVGSQGSSGGPSLPWASSGVKIGYIRSDIIMEKYKDYDDAENTLRSENRQWLDQAERMEREINRMVAEREELGLILSDERKEQLDEDIVEKRQELQKFRHDTWYDDNSEYIKRRKELMDPIDAQVNDAIWKIAEEKGLDLVLDTIAGNVVYVKPNLDITDLVLEELQR